jgi:hypothetical protein
VASEPMRLTEIEAQELLSFDVLRLSDLPQTLVVVGPNGGGKNEPAPALADRLGRDRPGGDVLAGGVRRAGPVCGISPARRDAGRDLRRPAGHHAHRAVGARAARCFDIALAGPPPGQGGEPAATLQQPPPLPASTCRPSSSSRRWRPCRRDAGCRMWAPGRAARRSCWPPPHPAPGLFRPIPGRCLCCLCRPDRDAPAGRRVRGRAADQAMVERRISPALPKTAAMPASRNTPAMRSGYG